MLRPPGALLSRMFPQRLRATIFGAFLSAASLGSVLGVVIGGVVAAKWGWRAAFVVVGVPGLLLALLFLLVRDYRTVRLPAGSAGAPKAGARGLLAELLRPRSAVAAYLGGATQIVVMSALYAWLPSYFNRYLGLHTAQAAARTALVMLAGFIGQIVLSYAADRLARRDRRRRLLLPAALSVVSLVLLVVAFAAMRPGSPQLLVILVAGLHHHRPVRRGRLGVRGRGGPCAASHRRIHGRAGAEPVRLRRRPARGRRGVRRLRPEGRPRGDPGVLRVRRLLPLVRLPALRQ